MASPIPLRQLLSELAATHTHSLRNGTLLDLGCGLGEDMFWLHHRFGMKAATGVDQIPSAYVSDFSREDLEQQFLERFGHPLPFHKYQFTSGVRDQYELYARWMRMEMNASALEMEEWEATFHWHWGTDARGFVQECEQQFDLVFCAGLLHWLPREEQRSFQREVMALVKPGGVLAIQANAAVEGGPRYEGPFSYVEVHQVDAALAGMDVLVRRVDEGKASWIVRG